MQAVVSVFTRDAVLPLNQPGWSGYLTDTPDGETHARAQFGKVFQLRTIGLSYRDYSTSQSKTCKVTLL